MAISLSKHRKDHTNVPSTTHNSGLASVRNAQSPSVPMQCPIDALPSEPLMCIQHISLTHAPTSRYEQAKFVYKTTCFRLYRDKQGDIS